MLVNLHVDYARQHHKMQFDIILLIKLAKKCHHKNQNSNGCLPLDVGKRVWAHGFS